jgi:hypothetical protein
VLLHVLDREGQGRAGRRGPLRPRARGQPQPKKQAEKVPVEPVRCCRRWCPVSKPGRSWTEVVRRGHGSMLAEKDPRVLAITAAMPDGTGLMEFRDPFPERFARRRHRRAARGGGAGLGARDRRACARCARSTRRSCSAATTRCSRR